MEEKLAVISSEKIVSKIYIIRNKKVMLDKDLAELYNVKTKDLNASVKRNEDRFPEDFMFKLTKSEFESLRLQISTSNRGGTRYLPQVFTEQGVAMLSGVLKSKRAVAVNIQIIRTFVKMRELMAANEILQRKIIELEKKYGAHDEKIKKVFDILQLLLSDENKKGNKNEIGFK